VPAVQSGNHVYVSGQLPMVDGKLAQTGKVGARREPGAGRRTGPHCALNALAAIDALVGLGRILKIVKVTAS
jgi:enamine deaminase RidA (YjgF/YER057c/UK114 family)